MIFSTLIHKIRSRLATKLILVVLLLISAVSTILTAFFISRQKQILSEELYKRVHALARNLSYNSGYSVYWLEDNDTILQSLVSGVKEEADIEDVFIADIDGKILASTDTSYSGAVFSVPIEVNSASGYEWLPSDNPLIRRMITPVEVDVKAVDTGNTLIALKNEITSSLNEVYWYHIPQFPRFNSTSDEISFTTILGPKSPNEGHVSILSFSPENRRLRLLVYSASNGYWSHNGRYLVFNKMKPFPNCVELSVLDMKTGDVKLIARDEAKILGIPCFTHDDHYVISNLAPKGGPSKLFRIPVHGGEPIQLTFHDGSHWYPSCSPDGKWILYTSLQGRFLYVYNTETKTSSRVYPECDNQNWFGSFSPDGSQFCYLLQMAMNSFDVFVAEFPVTDNGKSQTNSTLYGTRLTFTGGYKYTTNWSPDGKWIVYCQRPEIGQLNLNRDIWIVPAKGGDPINLTASLPSNPKTIGYSVLDVSLESLNRAIAKGNYIALIITIFMTGLGAVSAVMLVRNIVRPVDQLEELVGKIAEGDLDQKVTIQRSDEIGRLAQSFNQMTQQLKTSLEDIKSKNQELEKAYKELETLDKAKDDFLSLVSHELRTPLSSILLSTELMLYGQSKSEEKQKQFLTTTMNECRRLTRLTNDVLDLSKIEAGRMEFHIGPLNVRELIEEVINTMQTIIEKKALTINYNVQPEADYLQGDRDKVIQVITNIISNAIKYTPDGGSITVSVTCDNETGTVAIQDTGKGIEKEDIPKVFDKFRQLENIAHHSDGTGLGMSIAKSIIERLGGSIRIESEPGKGSTVFFTLPIAEKPENKIRDKDTVNNANSIAYDANNVMEKKILIVDDEQAMRFTLKECIDEAGFIPITASGGEDALRMVAEHKPSLILLDVMMPGMSGIEVCRKLRENPKTSGIKIIMLSARGQEKEKEEGMQAGADRYVTKPFNYHDLLDIIEELLKD
ncbi:MAG: response regulator [Candidatus Latescibacteria bacterium]|nr:response regulator [Candidatus Latescibacterota bacterium]